MFDEISKEPEDVFAQTDAAAPQMTPPTMNAPQPTVAPAPAMAAASAPVIVSASEKRPFPWKLVVLFVAIVVVVGLAFFLSMKILNSRTPVTPSAPVETAQPATQVPTPEVPAVAPTTTPVDQTAPAPTPVVDQTLDSDKDGLTDVREAQLGTNPNNPDTDGDGLFDKEEVDVYHTNPLNPDTDGDGFKDGDEVKKGYNPNGPGKLLQIPQK
ncbi:MAG: hypothetical protein NTX72_02130 [Candidatus Uhrbacteria bacterium]|nr:hypothetical protein [Candidatus Uhrbacteria bacterium]